MTKERLVELVVESLNGGRVFDDKIGQFHDEVIATYISLAWQKAIGAILKNDGHTQSLDAFNVVERGLEPVEASSGEKLLVLKQYKPINLDQNNGIRAVYPSGFPTEVLWYVSQATKWVHDDLLGVTQNPNGFYDFSGGTIFLDCQDAAKAYDVNLIPEFYTYKDTDTVSMPQRFETDIIDIVKQQVLQSPQPDLINDSK